MSSVYFCIVLAFGKIPSYVHNIIHGLTKRTSHKFLTAFPLKQGLLTYSMTPRSSIPHTRL
jgi:hypothetical protein